MSERQEPSGQEQSRSTRAAPQSLATPLSNPERAARAPRPLTSAVRTEAAAMRADPTRATLANRTLATTSPVLSAVRTASPQVTTPPTFTVAPLESPTPVVIPPQSIATPSQGNPTQQTITQTASESGGSSSQAATDEIDATQPSAPAGPRNLTEYLQTLSQQFAELSSVLRGIRSQKPSGAGPNPDDMVTPSDSFHPAGNGATPRTSQASHTQSPASPTGESFETMFTRVMSGCADTLCDFARKRLDEYVAGPEFGQ